MLSLNLLPALALGLRLFAGQVQALAATDSIMDADLPQSGYLPNHNIDPNIITGGSFGQLWKSGPYVAKEHFYAKPLIYTPPSTNRQIVFTASSQNYIRTHDAITGALLASRFLRVPFNEADIHCTDTPDTLGVTGTPIIDPATDTAYFYAKSYIPNYRAAGNTGVLNGVYYFYAVDVKTLNDVPGFPVLVEGTQMQNDPLNYFIGGPHLQRPSLTMINGNVYAAFGAHCDYFNYTGVVLGFSPSQKKVITAFATEAGPLVPHKAWNVAGGGAFGGIWQSGMALATDGNRMFFVTGNGNGHQNNGGPQPGSSGLQTLDECIVNLNVGADGKVSLKDYFQPYDYMALDAADRDLGSGGICLLDPKYFGNAKVSKLGVTVGKSGKIYFVNADNLGGYKNGAGQTDGVVQTISTSQAVFGGAGSYPLEGGFVYVTPIGGSTNAYKLGRDSAGNPVFNKVGASVEKSAGRIGVGAPTVTSFKGTPGSGIVWVTDVDAGLRAWRAVPDANGVLTTIKLPQTNGIGKFQRPAFGDGRVYLTDSAGALYCLGAPVNLPLTCTSPLDFGNVNLGSTSTKMVSCTANVALTKINGASTGDPTFKVSNSSFPVGAIAKGQTFTFPVTWNLTETVVKDAIGASYPYQSPGVKSTALTISTVPATVGFSANFPVSLTGNEVSNGPFLSLSPTQVDFGGIVLPESGTPPTVSSSFVISNIGSSTMKILGYSFTKSLSPAVWTNTTKASSGTWNLGPGFTSTDLPAVGTTLNSNTAVTVSLLFTAATGVGAYSSIFEIWTDGGNKNTLLTGSAANPPITTLTLSNDAGGWVGGLNLNFGTVTRGQTKTLQVRLCNSGGSVNMVTKSKPPGSNPQLVVGNAADLSEGLKIAVNACALGNVVFKPATGTAVGTVISDSWVLNTDDPNFGVHIVAISGTAR